MKEFISVAFVVMLFACSSSTNENNKRESETYQPTTSEQHVERYPNGVKKIEGKLVDGKRHGKWIYYYDNGFIWSEGNYKNGIREGFSFVYYKNGQKKISGKYKKNLRIGEWEVYEQDGRLVKTIDLNEMLTTKDSVLLELKQ